MSVGKLYSVPDRLLVTRVRYRILEESPNGWAGIFVPADVARVKDGGRYIVELEDRRVGYCGTRVDASRQGTFRFGGKRLEEAARPGVTSR